MRVKVKVKIRPCPRCGGKKMYHSYWKGYYSTFCINCRFRVIDYGNVDDPIHACLEWNKGK